MLGIRPKDPDDVLDYDVHFDRYLPADDPVASATASADDGITVDSVSVNGQVVKVWVSGGLHGSTYAVTVSATSAGGRQKDATFKLRVRNC